MSQLLVQNYLNEIDRLRKFSGVTNEQVIRPAFRRLLDQWATSHKLVFLEEYPFATSQKTTVYPDGTVLHDIRVPLGFWEAKDTKDDLEGEIEKKFRRGYPQDNIIFENSETAILIQNRQEVMRSPMIDTDGLLRLLTLFFSYERQEIAEFRKAVAQFKADLPAVLDALRKRIDTAYDDDADFRAAAKKFLEHCKDTINPTLGEADVREMLIQHILTEEIFNHVFDQGDFHRENNIARELYTLEGKFFTGQVKRETLKGLEPYYAAIRANAAQINSHHEKQTFLKVIYENFYKVYNPKAADRLGVVYTPNEIVKFMIEGADWLTQKHFGKALIDEHVEILDPATGTGTFICELLEHFRGQPQKLAHKYKNELHANEVAILPYYVANLNIEATYAAISGQFAEFPNLCFVDTLDNVAGLGIKAGYQHDMFAGLSEENVERVKRQNKRKISVVIGNPPYNANQQNENENNQNRTYPRIDELIKSSYIRLSTAQKTKLYDMYARFFRWATDRLHDDGVLAFVTNRSFIDSRTFDGFRRAVAQEFHEAYIIDLKGNARNSGEKRRREGGNVFDDQIKVGIAVSFWVKKRRAKGFTVRYEAVRDYAKSDEKRSFLASAPLSQRRLELLEPDKNANWINLTENEWDDLIPVADKKTKAAKAKGQERAVFRQFGNGVNTARDQWVTDPSVVILRQKVALSLALYTRSVNENNYVDTLKWSRNLKGKAKSARNEAFNNELVVAYDYRPFFKVNAYLSPLLIDELGFLVQQGGEGNIHVAFPNGGDFRCLATERPLDFHFIGDSRVVSRYRYTATGERIDNITDWALKKFREAYSRNERDADAVISPLEGEMSAKSTEGGDAASHDAPPSALSGISPSRGEIGLHEHPAYAKADRGRGRPARQITKDDIFTYVYGVLHDPVYREKYAINLKREFPRIPFYPDFRKWAEWGERLMALHIRYETVEPWPLERLDTPDEKARAAGVAPRAILKADRDNGIIRLDTETQLSGIPSEAWDYRLGNRSGLDWILDQYKEKTPKDPTIREKFNTYRFADYKEKVIDLLMRVTRVSVETVAITEAMKEARR
ncbi:type ISP restriction/modification enzyme [Aquibium sp. LZ166]|uniref:site-specific DNA-methyltransferase (adenine-specific) n=1 Tax=Aquibium pacificus TaxID=3153579 RepID=A0ABV3SQJ6_9HYPH